MALTDYDKKNLSSSDQKKIQNATDKWNAANAKGDKAGMAAAAAEAAAVRNNAGYKTDSSGNYSGTYTPTSSGGTSNVPNVTGNGTVKYGGSSYGGGNSGGGVSNNTTNYSQYTSSPYTIGSQRGQMIANNMGLGESWTNDIDGSVWKKNNDGTITVTDKNGYVTPNAYRMTDLGTLGTQQMSAGLSADTVEGTMWERYYKAQNDPNLQQYMRDGIFNQMYQYVQDTRAKENQDLSKQEMQEYLDEWLQQNQQPTAPHRDPRIDELLNQILNREDFSYNALNDPLYQQYKQAYQREGDRAMKETLAEAAANAGGMNSYAITAAQQANSYYNSQLNDKIPELYQLAYDMYLNDKESQVQNLGILQNMDESQYNRYRDTMYDWYNDKNFAYGMYQDAVNQGQWKTELANNNMLNNLNFAYNNYWDNKKWDASEEEKEYNRGQAEAELEYNRKEQDRALAETRANELIGRGEMPDDDMITQAGLDKSYVLKLVNAVRRELGLLPISTATGGYT